MNREIGFGTLLLVALAGCGDDGSGGAGGGATVSSGASNTATSASNATSASTKAASGSTGTATTSTTSTASASTTQSASSGGSNLAPVTIVWSNVAISADCFLFSDPDVLGTSATMETNGAARELVFPASGQAYSGNAQGGDLALGGAHTSVYDGDTWQFTETFVGTVSGNAFTGTWRYTECNMSGAPATCPADGGCTGTASFVISGGAP